MLHITELAIMRLKTGYERDPVFNFSVQACIRIPLLANKSEDVCGDCGVREADVL